MSKLIGFGILLTLVFIVLKLTDNIDWSWWWVLSPFWLPITIVAVIFFFVLLMIKVIETWVKS